ncbi:3-hydroxyacyl-CoA dehydrogenase NAD-binding domain-containing protein [Luteipulveratus sp. YIM 133132]|uniref:3-hydroxyacyl-CoA dehydrogenase NAD-binding domain-containing protein n=1 Tax=Luteipulveratus flavus TaxID=3031728 RepID=A0ABT6CA23_9MICO|nr:MULTISPECIES: 3-hydroxyacyl-CoA dehydrogenase NAD-binding domain-containing protein [unclassified Luteipulveratus]MDE9364594.1 3-hydroxyacyl-CoA dehydrogenase NAD-binding domain-containing protein [Luteipulveratus sp. YIM 133132]MDF8265745.1 3-hydroxyacyl-CoA dehydrogenase NAD-binding domain-containing protein [Luteipulveratus sp. YIM 133296]
MILNGDDPDVLAAPVPVAVVGAGAMGSGIAQIAAQAGHDVHLVDAVDGAARAARERLHATLSRLAGKGKISAEDAAATASRLHVAPTVRALPQVGLVIEAAVEDLTVKQALFAELEARQDAAVLATNTSSLDTSAIASGLHRPDRVIGLHFFNPPPLMRLVEVIHGPHNATEAGGALLDAASELMRRWGKTPVRCTSTPGFIVNRVARPFYGEAQRMVGAGEIDPATLDLAMRDAGFRMGPMELTDLIGQDVNLAVGTSVWEQTGRDPRYEPTDYQRDLVSAGRLGRKSGAGVFTYDDAGVAQNAHADVSRAATITAADAPLAGNPVARTLAMLVNEAVDLVARDEATAEDVDTAMRLGTNYPKGPFEWGREIGFATIADQLTDLDRRYPGGRYRPSPALRDAG